MNLEWRALSRLPPQTPPPFHAKPLSRTHEPGRSGTGRPQMVCLATEWKPVGQSRRAINTCHSPTPYPSSHSVNALSSCEHTTSGEPVPRRPDSWQQSKPNPTRIRAHHCVPRPAHSTLKPFCPHPSLGPRTRVLTTHCTHPVTHTRTPAQAQLLRFATSSSRTLAHFPAAPLEAASPLHLPLPTHLGLGLLPWVRLVGHLFPPTASVSQATAESWLASWVVGVAASRFSLLCLHPCSLPLARSSQVEWGEDNQTHSPTPPSSSSSGSIQTNLSHAATPQLQ